MGRFQPPPDRPGGPKRPPTGNDEPFRVTRPRIAPPPPLPPRPTRAHELDEKQAELVRAYVQGEEIPASDPPPPSDPEPSFQSSLSSSEPPPPPPRRRARLVEVPADMTLRPRRSVHQKIKDWADTVSHAQKIIVAVSVIGATVGPFAYRWTVEPIVKWVRTRASTEEAAAAGKKVCEELLAGKADADAVESLRAEMGDAGVQLGKTWDEQDKINANVHRELSRLRSQTPPAPLGPKAKAAAGKR